jgi:glycerophosphoryl diester phosphodiesterase
MSWLSKPPFKARPWVLGHRGDRTRAPENTLSAFSLALDGGADGVELDVRLSADGQVVVLHDRDCSRVTGGRVSELAEHMPLRRLLEVELDQGERIPTLDQALSWASDNSCRLNVELKNDGSAASDLVDAVLQCIARSSVPTDNVLLSSFEDSVVTELSRRETPAVAWLVDSPSELRQARELLWGLGITIVHPKHTLLTGSTLAELKHNGYVVNTWTVNDPERARELSAGGVDAIITDDPTTIVSALEA